MRQTGRQDRRKKSETDIDRRQTRQLREMTKTREMGKKGRKGETRETIETKEMKNPDRREAGRDRKPRGRRMLEDAAEES